MSLIKNPPLGYIPDKVLIKNVTKIYLRTNIYLNAWTKKFMFL